MLDYPRGPSQLSLWGRMNGDFSVSRDVLQLLQRTVGHLRKKNHLHMARASSQQVALASSPSPGVTVAERGLASLQKRR